MDLDKLTMGDKIVAGTGIVLIIGLFAFPWHSAPSVRTDFGTFGGGSISALSTINTFPAVLALLLTLALVGVVLAQKLGNVALPDAPAPWSDIKFYVAVAVLGLLVLKLILETNALGWGAYINILLAGGMAYGGFLIKQEGPTTSATPPSTF